jgi:hypothetical protein
MPSQFLTSYAEVLKGIYGEPKPEWSVPSSDLAAAEAELNARLPTALSDLYLLCGNFRRLHKAIDRMREPLARESTTWRSGEPLERAGSRVVFYEEGEACGYYAFDAEDPNQDDPKVFVAEDVDGEWFEWGGTLTEFLTMQLHWQLGNGGAPVGGLAEIDRETMKRIRTQFPLVLRPEADRLSHIEVFYRDGQSIVAFEDDSTPGGYFMHCAMSSEAEFDEITEKLQIQEWWDNWFPGDGTDDD